MAGARPLTGTLTLVGFAPLPGKLQVTLGTRPSRVVQQQIELLPGYDSRTLVAMEQPLIFSNAAGASTSGSARLNLIEIDGEGRLVRGATHRQHVRPFEGGRLDPASLAVNGIDPYHPLRIAATESDALGVIFGEVRRAVREQQCTRAILVGHNASFDLGFLNAAVARAGIRRNPFHPFSCFDTATLAGVAYGQTVLSRALQARLDPVGVGQLHAARVVEHDRDRASRCRRRRFQSHRAQEDDGDQGERQRAKGDQ